MNRGNWIPIIWKRLSELDLMGVCIPEKYGGSGMDYNSLAIVCEELETGDTPSVRPYPFISV